MVRDFFLPAHRVGGGSGKKFSLHAKNGPKSAFWGSLGEFCTGWACQGRLRGEFCTGWACQGRSLGEFCTGWACQGRLLGEFCTGWAAEPGGRESFVPGGPAKAACWESFVPGGPSSRAAGRVICRVWSSEIVQDEFRFVTHLGEIRRWSSRMRRGTLG